MLRQIKLLSLVQLRNLFGINELCHTKDKSKRKRYLLMGILWVFIFAMMEFYFSIIAWELFVLGVPYMIPGLFFALTSVVILFFTIFKAGSVIFQMKTYELLMSLPVSQSAIVVARFVTMYVTNLLLSIGVMAPGLIIYAINIHPGITFYLYGILGILLLPMFPITLATAAGALITAVSARMKHKSMVSSALTIILIMALFAGSMLMSNHSGELSKETLKNMAGLMEEQIRRMYPFAVWYRRAAVEGNWTDFILLLAVSFGPLAILTAILNKCFLAVCTTLNATSAKNNYKIRSLKGNSPLKTLWKRELKRYFSCSIYVTNTLIGYLFLAAFPLVFLLADTGKNSEMELLLPVLRRIYPALLGLFASMTPTTSSSISLEGKQWWIIKTLPIPSKLLFDSKILMNLSIGAPFYVVSGILSILILKPGPSEGILLLVIPGLYLLFAAVSGITVNLIFPVFNWENETRVVKQSAATFISMVACFILSGAPIALLLSIPSLPQTAVLLPTGTILLIFTILLYLDVGVKSPAIVP